MVNYVSLDEQSVANEIGRTNRVGVNAADACGGHENMLRPLRLKEVCDGRTIGEIQFTVCARNDVGKAGPLQGAENCAADETAMTRHIDFEIGRAHGCTPVTNAHLVCRLLLEKKKRNKKNQ